MVTLRCVTLSGCCGYGYVYVGRFRIYGFPTFVHGWLVALYIVRTLPVTLLVTFTLHCHVALHHRVWITLRSTVAHLFHRLVVPGYHRTVTTTLRYVGCRLRCRTFAAVTFGFTAFYVTFVRCCRLLVYVTLRCS